MSDVGEVMWGEPENFGKQVLKGAGYGSVNLINFFIQLCLTAVWNMHRGVDDKIHRTRHEIQRIRGENLS